MTGLAGQSWLLESALIEDFGTSGCSCCYPNRINWIESGHAYIPLETRTRNDHWQTAFSLFFVFFKKVKVLLNEKLLKEEIAHLESTRLLRDRLTAAENWDGNDDDFLGKRRDSASDLYFKSDRLRLLFKWCKMVCRIYGLKVRN